MELKVLWLYNDILNLNGDLGNIKSLEYRCKKRKIQFSLEYLSFNEVKSLKDYDLIYIGGGTNREIKAVSNDLLFKKEEIENAIKENKIFFLAGNSFYLFGSSFESDDLHKYCTTLNLFPYRVMTKNGTKSCVGNIKIKANLDEEIEIIGFENHNTYIYDVMYPLGKVLTGNGNIYGGKVEGFYSDNVIATNIIGPVLPRNPKFTDFLIRKALNTKYQNVELKEIDDTIEKNAFTEMEKI